MSCWSRDRASTSSGCTLCASARVQFSYIQLCLCGFTHQLPRKSVVFDIFCSSTFFYSRRNTANAYNICILLSIIFALKCILDSSVFCSQVYLALQCILFYSSEVQTILVSGVQQKWPHGQDSVYVIVRFIFVAPPCKKRVKKMGTIYIHHHQTHRNHLNMPVEPF